MNPIEANANKSGNSTNLSSTECNGAETSTVDRRHFLQMSAGLGAMVWLPRLSDRRFSGLQSARGTVFHNRDGSGRPSAVNPGIANVAVSNGDQVVLTDEQGQWELPVDEFTDVLFVIKPRGWMVSVNEHQLPQHSYRYAPQGSPKLRFGGLAATGDLPASIDFGLMPQEEPDSFRAVICGDPQPRDLREIDYIARTVVPRLQGTSASFAVSLGDIMFDNLSLYPPLVQSLGLVGLPWFNVLGNHDLDYDADNRHAHDSFKQQFGASYFAFDWGPVHFIVLDNVEWTQPDPQVVGSKGSYRGWLGQRQLNFVKNDLANVPADKLVVLMMHIPLHPGVESKPSLETGDREALFEIIRAREHLLTFSAHLHWHGNLFLGPEHGWHGAAPLHHIVTGTLCGSWFTGAAEANGIPHGTMSDGTPRGFVEVEFSGNQFNIDGYRSVQYADGYQMRLDVPREVEFAELRTTVVYANVFNGTQRSKVEMRIGNSDNWIAMDYSVEVEPYSIRLQERDAKLELPLRPLGKPGVCFHLWKQKLPTALPVGTHIIEVRETDMYGNHHHGVTTVQVI